MSLSIAHTYLEELDAVANTDVTQIRIKDAAYGGSWKKRGGIGAYMMMCRKWDRLEQSVQGYGYDIFKAIEEDPREESTLDDVRDLRRYLMLIEAEIQARITAKRNARAVDNFHPNAFRFEVPPVITPLVSPNSTYTTPNTTVTPQTYTGDCPCGDGTRPGHPTTWCQRESLAGA